MALAPALETPVVDTLNFDDALAQGDALLERYDSALDRDEEPEVVITAMAAELRDWISRVRRLGIRIGSPDDRQRLQGRINYWTSVLTRFGEFSGTGALADYDESVGEALDDSLCPYPGLRPCREGDVFVGREAEVKAYCEHILQHRLLAIVGRSGTGKSSIVIAGMLPFLTSAEATASWVFLRRRAEPAPQAAPGDAAAPVDASNSFPGMTPGVRPLHSLVRMVADATGRANDPAWHDSAAERLLEAPDQAAAWLAEALPGKPLFLFVDQFEELFSLCNSTRQRFAFQGVLWSMLTAQGTSHRVVLTMRTDHLDVFEKMFPDLHQLTTENMRRPSQMTLDDLVRVIQVPASSLKPVKLQFSPPSLVDKLARETQPLASGLPLLQFALTKLWQHRQRDKITQASYVQLPNVQNSLADTADSLYQQFNEAEQRLCRRMMIELAVIVGFEEPLRRRVRQADLVRRLGHALGSASTSGDPMAVIDAFFHAGLLIRTGQGDELQIEVAHEALFRNWAVFFEEWLPAEKNDILLRQRIESDAQEWRIAMQDASTSNQGVANHPADLLSLKGDRLQAALRLRGAGGLDVLAQTFVQECVDLSEAQGLRDAAAVQATKRAESEQAAAETARKQRNIFLIVMLLAPFVAWGYVSFQAKNRDADLMRMLNLAAKVSAVGKPTTALDVAYTQAMRLRLPGAGAHQPEARQMLSRALYATDGWSIFANTDIGGSFSTGGRYFIQLDTGTGPTGRPPFWSVSTIEGTGPRQTLALPGKDLNLRSLQTSDVTPDGRYAVLVWASPGREAGTGITGQAVWICTLNWAASKVDCPPAAQHALPGSVFVSMAMAADGSRVAIATRESSAPGSTVSLFKLDQANPGSPTSVMPGPSALITALGLAPGIDGGLVYGHDDGSITLANGPTLPAAHKGSVLQFVVGPDKDYFLSYGADGALIGWRASEKKHTVLINGSFGSASFNQKGDRAVAVVDRTTRCWEIKNGDWLDYPCHDGSPAFQAAFAMDHKALNVAKHRDTGALTRTPAYPVRDLGNWAATPAGALTFDLGSTKRVCPQFYPGPHSNQVEPTAFDVPFLCGNGQPGIARGIRNNDTILSAATTADGQWLAFAAAHAGPGTNQDKRQSVHLVAHSGGNDESLFSLSSVAFVDKLAVATNAGSSQIKVTVAATSGAVLHYAMVLATNRSAATSPEAFSLPARPDGLPNRFSCLAFSADGQRLVAGTEFGHVFSGTLVGDEWAFVPRIDERSKGRIPATITACSINAGDRIVVGTAGGGVFRIDGASTLRQLTRELLRFESSVGSVVIGDDGRVVALGQRPAPARTDARFAGTNQKQRLLVWQPKVGADGADDDEVADLLMVSPVFAVGVTPTSISALTDRGWVSHPCHGCEPLLDKLITAAKLRGARDMSKDELDRLAGK